jgi:hypothetical protein
VITFVVYHFLGKKWEKKVLEEKRILLDQMKKETDIRQNSKNKPKNGGTMQCRTDDVTSL